jgi:hypothetical protein
MLDEAPGSGHEKTTGGSVMVKSVSLAVLFCISVAPFVQAESAEGGEQATIPASTVLHCRISQTLTTKLNYQNDPFTANVSEPVMIGGREVIPVGAIIEGRIMHLERPGRVKGVGQMRLSLERLTLPDGRSFRLSATLMSAYGAENAKVVGSEGTVKGPSSRGAEMLEIAGGSIIGLAVGAVASHPLVGMTLGGTVGFVDHVRHRGKDLTIPTGTQLNYELMRALDLYHASEDASLPTHASAPGK